MFDISFYSLVSVEVTYVVFSEDFRAEAKYQHRYILMIISSHR